MKLDVLVHAGGIGLRTTSKAQPTVRVLDGEGRVRTVVVPAPDDQPDDGYQFVALPEPGDANRNVMLDPGDRIEVTLEGQQTVVTVPAMTATSDVAADVVSGQVPAGALPAGNGVYLQMHYLEGWFDTAADPAAVTGPIDAEGRFSLNLSGKFDIRPGTWGEVVFGDRDDNHFLLSFSPPTAAVYTPDYYANIIADPTSRPQLVIRNPETGAEYLRTLPATVYWGIFQGVALFPNGDYEQGGVQPQPGQEVAITLNGQAQAAAAAPVPWVTATVDFDKRAVRGGTVPGARTAVTLRTLSTRGEYGQLEVSPDTPNALQTVSANLAGEFSATFPSLAIERSAVADVLSYPGGAVAFAARGLVPQQKVWLYGDHVAAVLAGWGEVAVRLQPAASDAGRVPAEKRVVASVAGEIDVRNFAYVEPGDTLTFVPQRGDVLTLSVAGVTAEVDDTLQDLRGAAPPGSVLETTVYAIEPYAFIYQPYTMDHTTLTGRSSPSGNYRLHCDKKDCLRYGQLSARVDAVTYVLPWLGRPILGVGVTLSHVLGVATAGQVMAVTPLDGRGRAEPVRRVVMRPIPDDALPTWQVDLRDLYPLPAGLPVGSAFSIGVGSHSFEAKVPPFTWQADVAANAITGTGEPGRYLYISILPPPNDTSRAQYAFAQTVIGPDGRWKATAEEHFNLKPGDNLDLYVADDGFAYWYTEQAIVGEEPPDAVSPTPPPTTTPTAMPQPPRPFPSLMPTARPTAMPTDRPTARATESGEPTPTPAGQAGRGRAFVPYVLR